MEADVVAFLREVVALEAATLRALGERLDDQRDEVTGVLDLIAERCGPHAHGRLVTLGVGKAGQVARKLAGTFASTGTASHFVHPAEAQHGDLGMIRDGDVALALSNSGGSAELLALLPSLDARGVPLVAITGNMASPLAAAATHVLDIGAQVEACPLQLAPSTSTAAMLALGDGLALALSKHYGFSREAYARNHPAGALGLRLAPCAEVMRRDDRVAQVAPDAGVLAAMRAITAARSGCAGVVDGNGRLLGIFTDGDLRRAMATSDDAAAILAEPVQRFATMPCLFALGTETVEDALRRLGHRKVNALPVCDDDERLVGILDIQDLVEKGLSPGS